MREKTTAMHAVVVYKQNQTVQGHMDTRLQHVCSTRSIRNQSTQQVDMVTVCTLTAYMHMTAYVHYDKLYALKQFLCTKTAYVHHQSLCTLRHLITDSLCALWQHTTTTAYVHFDSLSLWQLMCTLAAYHHDSSCKLWQLITMTYYVHFDSLLLWQLKCTLTANQYDSCALAQSPADWRLAVYRVDHLNENPIHATHHHDVTLSDVHESINTSNSLLEIQIYNGRVPY